MAHLPRKPLPQALGAPEQGENSYLLNIKSASQLKRGKMEWSCSFGNIDSAFPRHILLSGGLSSRERRSVLKTEALCRDPL